MQRVGSAGMTFLNTPTYTSPRPPTLYHRHYVVQTPMRGQVSYRYRHLPAVQPYQGAQLQEK